MLLLFCPVSLNAAVYTVGPNKMYESISGAPWGSLTPGDEVHIYWKQDPYFEKWVINAQGTEHNPIKIIGIPSPSGQRPIISGINATTPSHLSFWNDQRGLLKIGGSSVPADGMPSHIEIEGLEFQSARPPYQFFDENNNMMTYSNNAAAIYVEKAVNLSIKNNVINDSGNGIFISPDNGNTQNILLQNNYIHDNGIVGRIYEHNAYSAGIHIIYEGNRFGPLRIGAGGNNLKDRSAGLVVRYNWVEGGNRQLDLVDAEDSNVIVNHHSYHDTHVYGNILIEPDGDGNAQVVHYGGDSGNTAIYRKGNLHFYNNTVISYRNNNTTLFRLSTQDEAVHAFNNVYYGTALGSSLALTNDEGTVDYQHNWFKNNWVVSHGSYSGSVNDLGNNISSNLPGFENLNEQIYRPSVNSPLIDKGMNIPESLLPDFKIDFEYSVHQNFILRPSIGSIDMGAFEFCLNNCEFIFKSGFEILK